MIGRKDLDPRKGVGPSAEGSNFFIGLKKGLGGKCSQGADDPGLNGLDLFQEKRVTAFYLIRFRVSILGGAAFNDIGNINFIPLNRYGLQDLRQELTCSPHKRFSLNI